MFSRQFLVQMAHSRELSPEQEEVFLLRFAENLDYEQIATQLQTSPGACLKRMGQVYNKFGISGLNRGKENRLRIFLIQELEKRETVESGKNVAQAQSISHSGKVLISYRSQEPDSTLAGQLSAAISEQGYEVFPVEESIKVGKSWPLRIQSLLEESDFLLLLLCPQSAFSDMLIEELRQAKEMQDSRFDGKPKILAIRVNFPFNSPISYDLRSYLQTVPQREWNSEADTQNIWREILNLMAGTEHLINSSAILDRASLPTAWESSDGRPLPVASPELPEGQVDLASNFYVERPPIESRCYEMILQPGALIRVKAPRQMGKTSLMARIVQYAGDRGCRTVTLSFHLAEKAIFKDLEQFLRWFCAYVGLELQLPNKLDDYWDDIFGSKVNCKAYFEKYLLPELDRPLVLGLDEVDRVFLHPEIADDFFGLLRAWHEESKKRDIWKKLRLVVVHSTEVYIPLDINQSPFNVGLPIELPEFYSEQVQELARRYGLNWEITSVKQLMEMMGGHPFLVRVALYHIARKDTTLRELLATAPTESGLYADHLRRHLWNLQQHPELAIAMREVVSSSHSVKLEAILAFKLHSMGLVNLQGNEVKPRCNLYRLYFRERLENGG